MMRFTTLARSGLLAGLLVAALVGCVEPSRRSEIVETIDGVSFEPGPAPPPGELPSAGTVPSGPTEPPLRSQIYPGRTVAGGRTSGIAEAQRSEDGVQLNFDRAEIREVARVILGDILRVAYTVDPDVQGEVTLSSSAPLSERDLLAVFESVLRSNGASLVETGARTYEIVPADAAIGRSQVVPMGGRPIQVRPGYGITIIPLRNISATAAAQFIQPLVASPEDIRIDPGRNAILFSGTAAERQNVIDTVADLDVDWMAGKSIGLFPLQRTTAEAIIPELQAIFAPFDPTGAEPSLIRFLPIARLNAVLAIGGDPAQIQEIDAWVSRLDRGETVGTQFYVYYLKHAAAEDVAKLLNETYADAGGAGEPGPSLASATTALTQAPPADTGEDFGAAPAPTPGAPATEPSAPPGPIKVVASKANNALLIRATPTVYESMEATLLRLDTAPWQVLIEATIAEVLLNDTLRYGVQAFLQGGSVRLGIGTGFNIVPDPSIGTNAIQSGLNVLFTPASSQIAIDALSQITDVKVLSAPSVVVQDNSEAELTVGDEVPIVSRQASTLGGSADDFNTLNSIEYRDTGVILQVRPRINSNQAVSLEIAQEVSRVNLEATPDDPEAQLTPTITQRKITSRVNVQSGQTVVLGGLIQDSETRGRSRVPVLGEIPIVGSLFGSTLSTNERTELIVFITPRVIRNPEDARDVSEELRSRLKSLSPSRAAAPIMPNVRPPSPATPPPVAPVTPPPPQPLVPRAMMVPQPRPPIG